MTRFLIAAAFAALVTPAFALSADDYSACVIGRAAIVMHNLPSVEDPHEAIAKAKAECPSAGIDEATLDEVDAYVEEVTEDLAGGLNLLHAAQ